jgi:hypothetical protein
MVVMGIVLGLHTSSICAPNNSQSIRLIVEAALTFFNLIKLLSNAF